MLRIVRRDVCRSTRSLSLRYYSIPTATPTPRGTGPLEPTPAPKKQKIDLRPAPIKPIQKPPLSATASIPPTKPHRHVQAALEATASPKLAEAKEEIKQDIHDAEAHGILRPPPPDANWFKRTLHTAIQLLVYFNPLLGCMV